MNPKTLISLVLAFLLVGSLIPINTVTASAATPEQVNDYATQVANFAKEKCHGDCDKVIILGDDYVIPSFRRDIKMLQWYYWLPFLPDSRVDKILTDIGYVQRQGVTFSEFEKIFVKVDWMGSKTMGKNVRFIIPRDYDAGILQEVERFEDMLKDKNYSLDVVKKYDDEIYCNDPQLWDNFNDVALFIFGNNNKALDCFPFVPKVEDSAFIDINPWDGRNYAVIIQTENSEVLQTFRNVMSNEDMYRNLQAEWITFVDTGLIIASIAATFVGADTFVDGADATFQCAVVKNAIACGASTAAFAMPLLPSGPVKIAVKKFISSAGAAAGKFILRYGDEAYSVLFNLARKGQLDSFKIYYKQVTDYFGDNWDVVIKKLNWGAADEVLAAKGTGRYVKELGENADLIGKKLSKIPFDDAGKAEFLRSVGKIDESFNVGEDYLKKIEFKDLGGTEGIYIRDGGVLQISNRIDAVRAREFILPHEAAHAKANKILKIPEDDTIWAHLNPSVTTYTPKGLDELMTNKLAKQNLKDPSQFIKQWNKDLKKVIGNDLSKFPKSSLIDFKAQALEIGDSEIASKIDNLIPSNFKAEFDNLVSEFRSSTNLVEGMNSDEVYNKLNLMISKLEGLS